MHQHDRLAALTLDLVIQVHSATLSDADPP